MSLALKTELTELPESRVRVETQIPASELDRSIERKAASVGKTLRIPGFRKGKVPPQIVIQRVGRESLLDDAINDEISGWYTEALESAAIEPVGQPKLELAELPQKGEPLKITIEVGVCPKAKLGKYKGLEVGRREVVVTEDQINEQLDQYRERLAKLEDANRPAQSGDFLIMDYLGTIDGVPFEGGEGKDQLLELGSGKLIPGFEDQLIGVEVDQERTLNLTFPEDYHAAELAGKETQFAVTVKSVREKVMPPIDDELAINAAGFDSLAELKEDIANGIKETEGRKVEGEFREAVVDAVAEKAKIDIPASLIEARAEEIWISTQRSLARQGISKEIYLQISGKTEEEIIKDAAGEAETGLKREAVVVAVIEAESIQPTEADVLAALKDESSDDADQAQEMLEQIRKAGREDKLTRDIAAKMAVDHMVESVKPITLELEDAREKLWTPDKG